MLNLAYAWTDKLMTYISYSEGFKSGGFDQRLTAPPPDSRPTTFEPETATAIEVGLKADLFDDRMRLNPSIRTTRICKLSYVNHLLQSRSMVEKPTSMD